MPGADAFEETSFLGLARSAKRDPYRLSLFAVHLHPDERALVFLAIHGGTLVVTDRRVLEFRAHLETYGAWNVKQFQGYEVRREVPRSDVKGLEHRIESTRAAVEDVVLLESRAGPEQFVVSRGPEATLRPDEFDALRAAVLGPQAK